MTRNSTRRRNGLEKRVRELERRVKALEKEIEDARAVLAQTFAKLRAAWETEVDVTEW